EGLSTGGTARDRPGERIWRLTAGHGGLECGIRSPRAFDGGRLRQRGGQREYVFGHGQAGDRRAAIGICHGDGVVSAAEARSGSGGFTGIPRKGECTCAAPGGNCGPTVLLIGGGGCVEANGGGDRFRRWERDVSHSRLSGRISDGEPVG